MANRLEATLWDRGAQHPIEVVDGLSYIRVARAGASDEFLTSSRLEAHRIASPFVREATLDGEKMEAVIGQRLGLAKDTPLDVPRMARAIMHIDPLCLLHGVFFAQKAWFGQPKFPRAVSAVIEAHDVRRAVSGGRKSDSVRHQLDRDETGGGTAEGYGSVPFHRVEWTARRIIATFVIDRELIRSYGLPQPATDLLETLALWEIRAMLSAGLRLRTACDLEVADDIATRRGEPLPSLDELTAHVRDLVTQSGDVLGDGKAITVLWSAKGKS
jgi:CRISPR-associated protein Csb1